MVGSALRPVDEQRDASSRATGISTRPDEILAVGLGRWTNLTGGAEGATGSAGRTESTSVPPHSAGSWATPSPPGARTTGGEGDVMSALPARPHLDQLRRQAKELLRAA